MHSCFCRLQEILEVAEDMAIDIPHMWLYLAELITPMLHEDGIPMGELFRSVALNLFIPQSCWRSVQFWVDVLIWFGLQGDFKAFDPSGKSWSPAGPDPHFTLQRNGESCHQL